MSRLWVAVLLTVIAAALLLVQGDFLKRRMRIKVEASDLLPKDHPKNAEFEFIRHTFQGSSRGFFVAVEAPIARLRGVVPEVARALEALPDVSFIRWRVEREYFEENLPLFQSVSDLKKQAAYLGEYRQDVQRLVEHGASLVDFLTALADLIDGEQELSAPTNEAAKDAKLAKDVESLTPFFAMLRRTLGDLGGGRAVDPRFVDRGIEDLLLRGWFDAKDIGRLDRELLVPEDVWERSGPTTALIWVATGRSDFDPIFSKEFMRRAGSIRAALRVRFPDCVFRFTGGIASYDTYASTVMTDFDKANVLGLLSVLVLLVVGFRSFAPFVLLMIFLFEGTMGTLVLQNLLFDGVNMIATAGALAIIGIGSDYGVIFLLTYQQETAAAIRDRQAGTLRRKEYLSAVRDAIRRALATIGTSTTVGCLVSVASFLALSGGDVIPLVEKMLGLPLGSPKGFQPIRELGVGGAVGLLDCLVMMLVFLPSTLYLLEWVKTHPLLERAGRILRPLRRRAGRSKRWLVLSGRFRLFMRTEHERRWFRALGAAAVRRRFWVVGVAFVGLIAAVVSGARIEWSTGQKEVEPRHSEAVEVSERIEKTFGKSFENLLVYGPLDVVRRFHGRVKLLADLPGTNVGEVTSIDDYLPSAGEAQEDKLALVKQMDASLAGIRAALPATALVVTRAEAQALGARLVRVAAGLGELHAGGAAAPRLAAARSEVALAALALLGARRLEPSAEWAAAELIVVEQAQLAAVAEACRTTADAWLEQQVPQARIAELKRIAGGVDALAQLGGGVAPRRDLTALRLALAGLGLADQAAALHGSDRGPPAGAEVAWLKRDALLAPIRTLAKFVADSGAIGLQVKEGPRFVDLITDLEQVTDFVALRARPATGEAGRESERLVAAAYRLRRSLDSLASFAAASGFAQVAPRMPAASAALDGLISQLTLVSPQRADGVARELDDLFAERLFDRFGTVRRAAAHVRRPLDLKDVPASALLIFSGQADGETLYLARVLPRQSMLERRPFQEIHRAVDDALRDLAPPGVRAGFSGFEVLLNLATDYLEGTFAGAMVTVSFFVLLALYLLHRSVLATLVVAAPVVLGTACTIAMMALGHLRITLFTVVAIPIVIGVATDSSIQVFRVYWDELARHGRASIPDVMAEVGKVVALNALSTVLPFGMMMLGDMKGLIALGTILAFGCLACFAAKLTLLPCLISIVHDFVVPLAQFTPPLYPGKWSVRLLGGVLGRWLTMVPFPDSGLTVETQRAAGLIGITVRRPPLNLMDASMMAHSVATWRRLLRDPDLKAVISRSGLPQHYLIEDDRGQQLLDARGKPKKIPASVAEQDSVPPGYKLVGPIRTWGAGADLVAMAMNPINAYICLTGCVVQADLLWYSSKPMIFIAEGDMVAGWFELALYGNFFLVTKHARLGAPEVKRGLTLPFGAHALTFRAGTAVAGHLMATGDLIGGEEAVRLGIADALVPDGEDPHAYALRLLESRDFIDKIRQVSILRQYGPNMPVLVAKSIRNYMRLLRDPDTRKRLREYLKHDL